MGAIWINFLRVTDLYRMVFNSLNKKSTNTIFMNDDAIKNLEKLLKNVDVLIIPKHLPN